MGTWERGLLDNDAACDALGDLYAEIRADIARFAAQPAATAELCAAVGILLQLAPYDFDLDEDRGKQIVAAVRSHAAQIAALPDAARVIMDAVANGRGHSLAARQDPGHAAFAELVHARSGTSGFGERHAALFANTTYVQTVADRCVAAIEDDMAREGDWSDMCREMPSLGLVPVLLAIAPRTLDASTVARWRGNAKQGIAELRARADDELDFHEGYYANLDRALALLAT